jgi:hypothetical protein
MKRLLIGTRVEILETGGKRGTIIGFLHGLDVISGSEILRILRYADRYVVRLDKPLKTTAFWADGEPDTIDQYVISTTMVKEI